jgi:hypothetical protein
VIYTKTQQKKHSQFSQTGRTQTLKLPLRAGVMHWGKIFTSFRLAVDMMLFFRCPEQSFARFQIVYFPRQFFQTSQTTIF